jgi:signal transduction histidine kinase
VDNESGDQLSPSVVAAGGMDEALKRYAAQRSIALLVRAGATPADVRAELRRLAESNGLAADPFLFGVFARVGGAAELRRLAPRVAVEVALQLLVACGPFGGACVWLADAETETCVASVGDCDTTRGPAASGRRRERTRRTAPIKRHGRAAGALVVTGATSDPGIAAFLAEATSIFETLLERDLQLERSAERERALTTSMERRLIRLAYDLHDGPLQDLTALAADAALLRRQLETILEGDDAARVRGRFDDIQSQLESLDGALRATLDAARGSSGIVSLEHALRQEAATLERISGIQIELEVVGEFDTLTDSRRVAIFRVVQEALSNARYHSHATKVAVRVSEASGRVEVSIADDGRGFDVSGTLARALGDGCYGLAGMRERVRLLGGDLEISSAAGRGTRIAFELDPWQPLAAAAGDATAERVG